MCHRNVIDNYEYILRLTLSETFEKSLVTFVFSFFFNSLLRWTPHFPNLLFLRRSWRLFWTGRQRFYGAALSVPVYLSRQRLCAEKMIWDRCCLFCHIETSGSFSIEYMLSIIFHLWTWPPSDPLNVMDFRSLQRRSMPPYECFAANRPFVLFHVAQMSLRSKIKS